MYVWEMVKKAVHGLGGSATNVAVRDWILQQYPNTNTNTISCQIIVCTVNHDSRVHYPENKKPRISNTQYDFLFRSGRGQLEFYDPQKHGQWEIYKKDDGKLGVRKSDGELIEIDEHEDAVKEVTAFAAESHLRDCLAQNLHLIEEGLELYVDEEGKDGVEYSTGVGFIDILCLDKNGEYVIIEVKVARGPDYVAGQILRYKNWIKINLAKGKSTRGIIIAQFISDKIRYAISSDPEILAKEYEINLTIKDVEKLQE
jgi:RecB family endonuclease NucS